MVHATDPSKPTVTEGVTLAPVTVMFVHYGAEVATPVTVEPVTQAEAAGLILIAETRDRDGEPVDVSLDNQSINSRWAADRLTSLIGEMGATVRTPDGQSHRVEFADSSSLVLVVHYGIVTSTLFDLGSVDPERPFNWAKDRTLADVVQAAAGWPSEPTDPSGGGEGWAADDATQNGGAL